MKQLFLACAIWFATVPVAFSQEPSGSEPATAAATSTPASTGDSSARDTSREELEQRIENSALRLVEKVLNAIGDEIPESEKQEILSEVRSEMESREESRANDSGAAGSTSRDDLEARIEEGVLRLIENVIAATGDDLSESEKQEILSEVKTELQSERESREHGLSINVGSDEGDIVQLVLPLLAVTLIFGTPIFIVIAVLYAGYRKRRLIQETISQYLASGKEVPPEILESIHGGAERPKNYLQKGFVMVGAGIGIFLAFAIMGSIETASLGLIPLFIGVAQLLIWKLEKPDNDARG
jgi:hypothetical protein